MNSSWSPIDVAIRNGYSVSYSIAGKKAKLSSCRWVCDEELVVISHYAKDLSDVWRRKSDFKITIKFPKVEKTYKILGKKHLSRKTGIEYGSSPNIIFETMVIENPIFELEAKYNVLEEYYDRSMQCAG